MFSMAIAVPPVVKPAATQPAQQVLRRISAGPLAACLRSLPGVSSATSRKRRRTKRRRRREKNILLFAGASCLIRARPQFKRRPSSASPPCPLVSRLFEAGTPQTTKIGGVVEATSESVGWQHFGKMLLVFGCIGSDFCKKICVLPHFSKSTRFSS